MKPESFASLDGVSKDAVMQTVTAIIHDDEQTASEIMAERFGTLLDAIALAATACDIAAYVHLKWAKCHNMTRDEALATWASIAGEIAEHRETGQ